VDTNLYINIYINIYTRLDIDIDRRIDIHTKKIEKKKIHLYVLMKDSRKLEDHRSGMIQDPERAAGYTEGSRKAAALP